MSVDIRTSVDVSLITKPGHLEVVKVDFQSLKISCLLELNNNFIIFREAGHLTDRILFEDVENLLI
jgi:hypothetical protein